MSLSEPTAWTVPDTAVHELEHVGRRWRVSVAMPLAAADGPARVVYVLDPLGTFGIAVHVARSLELLCPGSLPSLLVVGVGPATDDVGEALALRLGDLTPCAPDAPDAAQLAAVGTAAGAADDFLGLLLDVVAPEVERRYDADPADRTLAGWSLGGLAVAHALLTRPHAVRRYLLVSPSLWWAGAEILRRVGDLAGVDASLDVYVSAAEHEQDAVERLWPPVAEPVRAEVAEQIARNAMRDNARTFADGLRGLRLPGLTVHDEVLSGEHHSTTWAAAFTRGLLALHGESYRLRS